MEVRLLKEYKKRVEKNGRPTNRLDLNTCQSRAIPVPSPASPIKIELLYEE